MSPKTTLILLGVAIGACLVVVGLDQGWFAGGAGEQKPAAPSVPTALGEARELFAEPIGQVSEVRIESADLTATFVKQDEQWKITEPVEAEAIKWQVDSIVRTITGLKYYQKFEPGQPGVPSDAEMGLDKPKVTVTIKHEDGQASLQIGKKEALKDYTYVRLVGQPEAYLVTTNLQSTFDKQLKDFRQKELVKFQHNEAVAVEVVSREPGRRLKLTRQDESEWVIESPIKARAASAQAADLVTAVKDLRAEEFIDDNPRDLSRYGLEEPYARVVLTTRKKVEKPEKGGEKEATEKEGPSTQPAEKAKPQYEEKSYELLIGKYVGLEKKRRYAKLADKPTVVAVADSQVRKLLPELLELRDKRITAANTFKITKLIVADASERVTLEKHDGRWRMTEPAKLDAERSVVDELIRGIRGLRAAEFVDGPEDLSSYGLDKPQSEISFYVEGQVEPERIRVGKYSPSRRMLYVQRVGEASVAVVKAADGKKLLVPPVAFLPRKMLQVPRHRLERIELVRGDERMLLVKKDWQWRIVEPHRAMADQSGVASIVSDLASLRARQVVARGRLGEFGLDQPDVQVELVVAAPKRPSTWPTTTAATRPTTAVASQPAERPSRHLLRISKRDEKVYAVVDDKDLVYRIDPIIYEHLTAELHERKIMRFAASAVQRLTIRGSEITEPLEFAKVGESWTYVPDRFFQLDQQKLKDRINELRRLRAERFVEFECHDPAKYGLDNPAVVVEASLGDGKTISLLISARGPGQGKDRYAMVAGQKKVFVLTGTAVGRFRRALSSYEKGS